MKTVNAIVVHSGWYLEHVDVGALGPSVCEFAERPDTEVCGYTHGVCSEVLGSLWFCLSLKLEGCFFICSPSLLKMADTSLEALVMQKLI